MKKDGTMQSNSSGIVSVIFGILSIPASLVPFAGIFFGITGLIFGIVQAKSSRNPWSTCGIILSLLGIIFSVAFFLIALHILSDPNLYQQIQQSLQGGVQ